MVGAGQIVTCRLWGVVAEENGTGMADMRHPAPGIGNSQFQMLDGDVVGDSDGLLHVTGHKDHSAISEGGSGNILATEILQLLFQLGGQRVGQRLVGGHHDGQRQGIVLRLGKHIGGHILHPGGLIGDDQHLGRTGDHVDPHHAGNQPLGLGHILVARPDYDIDPGDGLGPIGQGGHRPGGASLENPGDTDLLCSHQQMGIHLAVLVGRGDHDPFGHSGDACRDAVHQDRGDQRRGTALPSRNIEPGRIDGSYQSPDDGAVLPGLQPGILHLPLMKGLDTLDGQSQGVEELRVDLLIGRLQLATAHLELCDGQVRGIEAAAIVDDRSIAGGADLIQNPGDHLLAGGVGVLKPLKQAGKDLLPFATFCQIG